MKKSKRIIVISGGGRGIGRAIAVKFAAAGFHIATFSRSEDQLKLLKKEITEKYSVEVMAAAFSITDQKAVQKFASDIISKGFEIAALVNNAGFFAPGQIGNEEAGVLEETMETNVYGTYYLTRAFLPQLEKQKNGHVFNMCSTASITPYTNGGSYCISKYALLGFSKVLREEMKPTGVKVTSVLPGATFTSSWEDAGIPEERFMKPEDIADTIFSAFNLSASAVVEEILLRPQLGDI